MSFLIRVVRKESGRAEWINPANIDAVWADNEGGQDKGSIINTTTRGALTVVDNVPEVLAAVDTWHQDRVEEVGGKVKDPV